MRQIAKKFGVNLSTVQTWKKRKYVNDKIRVRASKAKRKHIKFITKLADGKYTGIHQASARMITYKFNKHFNKGRKVKFTLGRSTVNKILNRELSKPRKIRTTFKLTPKNKEKRIELINYVKANNIKGQDIFFTDECRFLLDTPVNPQTNQIRFNKMDLIRLKNGDNVIYEKLNVPQPKYTIGFMVAGGISEFGVGKLIFCVGTMNTKSYCQTIGYYKEDVMRLNKNLYFQQDGASCHTAKKSIAEINLTFNNKLDFWPANSPDLSPIENIWSILKEKLHERKHQTLDDLKKHLIFLWNRIPVGLCRNS